MMLTLVAIGYRLHRFEVLSAVLICAVVTASALIATAHLDAAAALVPGGCYEAWFYGSNGFPAGCEGPVDAVFTLRQNEAGWIMSAMLVLPIAVGLLMGPSLVAGELETRTAETAWTLAGSRRRWLAGLGVPALILIVAIVGVTDAAATVLVDARAPWLPAPGWEDAGLFGPVVVARAIAGFAGGLLIGAIVGRTLPALAMGILASALLPGTAWLARTESQAANAVVIDGRNGSSPGQVIIGRQMFMDGAGEILTTDEAFARVPAGLAGEEPYHWLATNLREVCLGLPASEAPVWEGIENVGLGALAILLGAATVAVVERRRPR